MDCECADPGCPSCGGACERAARECLRRVDMEDHTGTLFCSECGIDAFGSGLFYKDVGAWIQATRKTFPIKRR